MTRYRGCKGLGTRFGLPAAYRRGDVPIGVCDGDHPEVPNRSSSASRGSFAVGGTVVTNPDSTAASICCAVAVR